MQIAFGIRLGCNLKFVEPLFGSALGTNITAHCSAPSKLDKMIADLLQALYWFCLNAFLCQRLSSTTLKWQSAIIFARSLLFHRVLPLDDWGLAKRCGHWHFKFENGNLWKTRELANYRGSLRSVFILRISKFGVWVKHILKRRRWIFLVRRLIS